MSLLNSVGYIKEDGTEEFSSLDMTPAEIEMDILSQGIEKETSALLQRLYQTHPTKENRLENVYNAVNKATATLHACKKRLNDITR